MELAKINDLNIIIEIDKKFYNDTFFNKTTIANIINKKSKNKLYISKNKKAYLMIFKMPNKSLYITSLAGDKATRRYLLTKLLDKYNIRSIVRIYTHAKEQWGTDLFRELGFKKKGKGNIDDEIVKFNDDISKLWLYEYIPVINRK